MSSRQGEKPIGHEARGWSAERLAKELMFAEQAATPLHQETLAWRDALRKESERRRADPANKTKELQFVARTLAAMSDRAGKGLRDAMKQYRNAAVAALVLEAEKGSARPVIRVMFDLDSTGGGSYDLCAIHVQFSNGDTLDSMSGGRVARQIQRHEKFIQKMLPRMDEDLLALFQSDVDTLKLPTARKSKAGKA